MSRRIRMLHQTTESIRGGVAVFAAGQTYELDDKKADRWVEIGWAEEVDESSSESAPISEIDGVPEKTAKALAEHDIGITTLGDLAAVSRDDLESALKDVEASSRATNAIFEWLEGGAGE